MGRYAFKGNTYWMALDDVDIIKEKVTYALNKQLDGVTLWEISTSTIFLTKSLRKLSFSPSFQRLLSLFVH